MIKLSTCASSLIGVELPEGMVSLGSGAFMGCSKLVNMEVSVTCNIWKQLLQCLYFARESDDFPKSSPRFNVGVFKGYALLLNLQSVADKSYISR